jgi:hypothetical protein
MNNKLFPMRWPAAWKSPPTGEWLSASSITTFLVDRPVSWSVPGKEVQVLAKDAGPPGIFLLPGIWPRVKGESGESRRGAEAGPTGKPWIDSNGWKLAPSLLREKGSPHWLTFIPPTGQVISPHAYVLSVADTEVYRGRWIVALDDDLAKGLASGNDRAISTWKRLDESMRFFQKQTAWRSYTPVANLAVVSSFTGPVKFLSEELLNLADRRPLPYRIFDPAGAAQANLRDFRAVVYIEPKPPLEPLRDKLLAFVDGGGLLLTSHPIGDGQPAAVEQNHNVVRRGKGRIAMPLKRWGDPYLLALDAHMLLGREHDVLRLYNAMTMNALYSARQDGRAAVVEVLNFSMRSPARETTVAVSKPYRTARMHTPDGAVKPLTPVKTHVGVEVPLLEFPVYCAVEFEDLSV